MSKLILTLSLLVCVAFSIHSQTPQFFNYQATFRDNNNQLLISKDISIRISILQYSTNGSSVYTETHDATTTSQGIVNLKIGSGNSPDGFSSIDWSDGPYFLKLELDVENTGTYSVLGVTQFLSVPYALYAERVKSVINEPPYWSKSDRNIYYNSGFVGIGTSNPITKLNIVGNVDDGDTRSFIRLKNYSTDPKATVSISLQSFEEKGVAFGYSSSNYSMNDLADFGSITTNGRGLAFVSYYGQIRFYTNKNQDNSYSEKMRINELGNVGIGTTNPEFKLQIADNNNKVVLGYQSAYDGPFLNLYSSTTSIAPMLAFGVAKKDYIQYDKVLTLKDWAYIYGNNLNLGISILPDLQTVPNGLYIKRNGFIGIGTENPTAKLDVKGDVFINDITSGIIMKSPDGQCWRGTIDNSGVLQFEAITCP